MCIEGGGIKRRRRQEVSKKRRRSAPGERRMSLAGVRGRGGGGEGRSIKKPAGLDVESPRAVTANADSFRLSTPGVCFLIAFFQEPAAVIGG